MSPIEPPALRDVTAEEINAFWRDGAVCLRGIMPESWLALLEEGLERWLHSEARFSLSDFGASRSDGAAKPKAHFYGGTDHWKTDPACRSFACDSPLPGIVGALLRSAKINLYEDSILVKEPGTLEKTMFHQDLPYFHVEGSQTCTSWVPLDPVRRETGSLLFVKGSHTWKKMYRPNYFVQQESMPDTEGEDAPDYHANRKDAEILCFDMERGDLTVHHALTLHGALGNGSSTLMRRAMSVRYCGDDARYRIRRGASQKPHHAQIQPGSVLDHPDCPVVWPR